MYFESGMPQRRRRSTGRRAPHGGQFTGTDSRRRYRRRAEPGASPAAAWTCSLPAIEAPVPGPVLLGAALGLGATPEPRSSASRLQASVGVDRDPGRSHWPQRVWVISGPLRRSPDRIRRRRPKLPEALRQREERWTPSSLVRVSSPPSSTGLAGLLRPPPPRYARMDQARGAPPEVCWTSQHLSSLISCARMVSDSPPHCRSHRVVVNGDPVTTTPALGRARPPGGCRSSGGSSRRRPPRKRTFQALRIVGQR